MLKEKITNSAVQKINKFIQLILLSNYKQKEARKDCITFYSQQTIIETLFNVSKSLNSKHCIKYPGLELKS